jgi:hypothetical protein
MPKPAPSRREFISLLTVAVTPLASVGGLRAWEKWSDAEKPVFDQVWLNKLQSRKAEIALIGNSMVFHRLSAVHLEERIAPLKSMTIAKGGWRSLAWLLGLKNLAAACHPPPRLAIVVYRDYDFANPKLNIERRYLQEIRSMMVPGDQALLDMARGGDSGSGWRSVLEDFFDPAASVNFVRSKLTNFAYDGAAYGADEDQVRTHVDEVFDLDQLRPEIKDAGGAESDSVDEKNTRFTADPARNYLLRFVSEARSSGTKLIFYRVKRRPAPDNQTVQSDTLKNYISDLKKWVELQGCVHIDETDDSKITLDMFRDGDHLHDEVRPAYTDLFLERVRSHLPDAFTSSDLRPVKEASPP